MATTWKKTGSWKRLEKAFNRHRFSKAMRKEIRKATQLNAESAERTIRKTIKTGSFAANRPLTVAIKKSSKPLVDQGHTIFQAVGSQMINDLTAWVGVAKTEGAYNIAVALHEGTAISVTANMRKLFFVLWKVSVGDWSPSKLSGRAAELWERMPGGWERLKDSTSAITIKGRPFIREAFANANLRTRARRNWGQAINRAMSEIAK
jgi:hypothetical protein